MESYLTRIDTLDYSLSTAPFFMGFLGFVRRVPSTKTTTVRTREEKAFVLRLDIFLMSYGFLSQVIKYLDQSNITNAYISGMQQDLNLNGNQLNFFTTYFNVGYVLMLIPSQIILTHVRPSTWLPALEIAWGIMTGFLALVQNANQVYALRFFIGLFESSAWPGMMTLFMYWYTPTELGKRMGIYHSAMALGGMMSGAIQVAILNTLDGSRGIAGWRWLFVINSVMTVVLGVAGFFMLPDSPANPNPRARWLTADHARLAHDRLLRYGRATPGRITWKSAKLALSQWVTWLIPLIFWTASLSAGAISYFGVFLKALKDSKGKPIWSTSQANAIPIAGGGVQVFMLWVWPTLADILQARWQLLVTQLVISFIPAIMLIIWTNHPATTPLSLAYAGYFITYACEAAAPLILSWLTDILPHDPDARNFAVGICVTGIYAINTGANVGMWPASSAPYYYYGWPVEVGACALCITSILAMVYLDRRYLRPSRLARESTVVEVTDTARSIEGSTEESHDAEKPAGAAPLDEKAVDIAP